MNGRFTNSPLRGWRWLFASLGALFGVTIVSVLLNAATTIALRDTPILVLPVVLLGFSFAMLYLGVFAADEVVDRWVQRLTRWAR